MNDSTNSCLPEYANANKYTNAIVISAKFDYNDRVLINKLIYDAYLQGYRDCRTYIVEGFQLEE